MKTPFRVLSLVLALALGGGAPARAGGDEALQFFKEEAEVITASRRPQSIQESPVAVDVITAEEISASGAVNLWDLLRFRAGLDVLDGNSIDGNRAVVSVRGFPAEYVDSLQILLDGRSVYIPETGGVDWAQLPVQLQDIERIEVVRGPNAALYGSNAGLGVINIITRRPREKAALRVEAQGGSLGGVLSSESFEDARGPFSYRLSHTRQSQEDSPGTAGPPANNFLYSNKENFRGAWAPAPGRTLDLFAGGSWDSEGVPTTLDPQARFRKHFEMGRWTQEAGEASSVELMAARAENEQTVDPLFGTRTDDRSYQYDVEALHRLRWGGDRADTTWGGSYRYSAASSPQIFAGLPTRVNKVWRGFVNQSFKVSDALSLDGAASIEESHLGGVQAAYQGAVVVHPWESHSFRLSHSMSPTLPTFSQKELYFPNQGAISVGNPGFLAQRLLSYEAGYLGTFLGGRLRTEASLYYLDLRNLPTNTTVVVPALPPRIFLSQDNQEAATARGLEATARYRLPGNGSVYANYAYERISDWLGDPDIIHGTPRHKFNLGGTAPLGRGWSLSGNAGYKDGYTITSTSRVATLDVPAYWRVDLRLAYAWKGLEVFVAGQNMLKSRHLEFPDGVAVARTFRGGLAIKF